MELNTIQRLSMLPAALVPSAPVVRAPQLASASRVHQVQNQAELGWTNGSAYATNGTAAFKGTNGVTVKPMTDARGVPPRGRPV